jgi:DNA polymerase-1
MTTKTTILIDGNSLGYAMHYGTKLTAGGIQTQAVFGFVKAMR